jgi:DNA-binding GntR family transcriptional regulator
MTPVIRAARPSGPHNQAEQAYRQVRELLLAGQFQPGDRLNEVDLSESLGMSRTPVREALRRLQSDGLVTPTGRGVVVAALSTEDLRHALDLQGALETLAAELAAARQRDGQLPPAEIDALHRAAEEVEQRGAAGDVLGVWRANLSFHQRIAELSGNPLLVESLGRIWARFAVVSLHNLRRRQHLGPDHPGHPGHRALVAAIAAGEPETAALAAREHGRIGRTHYLASLTEGRTEASADTEVARRA